MQYQCFQGVKALILGGKSIAFGMQKLCFHIVR